MFRQAFRRVLSLMLPLASRAERVAPMRFRGAATGARKRIKFHLYVPYGGKREIARRKRQIERGIILINHPPLTDHKRALKLARLSHA